VASSRGRDYVVWGGVGGGGGGRGGGRKGTTGDRDNGSAARERKAIVHTPHRRREKTAFHAVLQRVGKIKCQN